MFEIKASHPMLVNKYRDIYGDVIGNRFDTLEEAEEFLADNGWGKDALNEGEWTKDGQTRMCGSIGVSVMHYVTIKRV